jgi:hypothetical protein
MEPVGFRVGKQDDTHKGFEHTWAGVSIASDRPIAMQRFASRIGSLNSLEKPSSVPIGEYLLSLKVI